MVTDIKGIKNNHLFPGCPIGYTLLNKTCIALFTERKTWSNAQEFCRNETVGYDLMIIHDNSTNNYVKTQIEHAYKTDIMNKRFWIGLREKQTKARILNPSYVWGDGTALSYGMKLKNRPWLDNEPKQVILLTLLRWRGYFNLESYQS